MMDTGHTLEFSTGIFQNNFGVGLDHGDATIKSVYTTSVGDKITVHFYKKESQYHEELLKLLCDKCKDSLTGDVEIYICGSGTRQHYGRLSSTTGIRFTTKPDLACLVTGFRLLSQHQAWNDWVELPATSNVMDAARLMTDWRGFIEQLSETGNMSMAPSFKELDEFMETKQLTTDPGKVEYPVIVCDIGSGYRVVKLEADGSYSVVDEMSLGGKTLDGLASMLVGSKSWKELLVMAESGDPTKVDTYASDFKTDPNDELYHSLNRKQKAFPFGQVVGKSMDDVNKEDVAVSLLDILPDILMASVYSNAILHNVNQIFLVGGFQDTSVSIDTRQLEIMHMYMMRFFIAREHPCDLYFVKNAEFVSALGALAMNIGYNREK